MCLSEIHEVFAPPQTLVVKGFKVFERYAGKRFPTFDALICNAFQLSYSSEQIALNRRAREAKIELPGWPIDQWVSDKYQTLIESEDRAGVNYLTGFHAFAGREHATVYYRKLIHSERYLGSNCKEFALHEVELDEITTTGIQVFSAKPDDDCFFSFIHAPAVVARKMKIGKEIPCA